MNRLHDEAGRQLVTVNNPVGYAYAWNGDQPLKVGDRVMLPGNYVTPEPFESEISGLGSDFQGDHVMILRKLRDRPNVLPLRQYQRECIDALYADWDAQLQRLAVVLPTGTGKTVIMAHLIAEYAAQGWGRVGIFVHRDELVKQTQDKIHSVAPHLMVGVVKAERQELDADVVIISIQTIARQARLSQIPMDHFGLIIVDECHHAAAESYQRALEYFGCFRPQNNQLESGHACLLAGFTATLTRQDKLGLGDVFQKVSYKKDIIYGIRHGFLVDPRGRTVNLAALDLDTDVTRSGGDFTAGSLGDALSEAQGPAAMAATIATEAEDRQGIVFWPTVATAREFTDACHALKITAATLTGETSPEDRALLFKRVRAGEIQVISNVMVGTEGLDIPQLSFVGIGRPTTNAGLLTQMIGRGLRPWKEHRESSEFAWLRKPKTDCLVFLLAGATGMKLATLADLSTTTIREIKDGEGLQEAIEREAIEDAERLHKKVDPSLLRLSDVDLFAGSSAAWLQTVKGYWFIPTRDWLFVLYPETDADDSLFMVGRVWCGKGPRQKGRTIGREMAREYGKAWAESEAEELDPSLAKREAPWRKKKTEPARPAQIRFANDLGIPNADSLTKVELSDQISIVLASRILDRYRPPTARN